MSYDAGDLDRMLGAGESSGMPPVCVACGYNLTGATSGRCPECGRAILRSEQKRRAAELRTQLLELDGINEWVAIGFKVGIAGLALRLAGAGMGLMGADPIAYLCRLPSLPCGFVVVCLGLSVLRAHRVPPWAREMLSEQPKYALAVATVLLGLLLAASSLVRL